MVSSIAIKQQDVLNRTIKQTEIDEQLPNRVASLIPAQQIELTVSALKSNAKMPLSVPYWEGPIVVEGTHSGTGYMELTGYKPSCNNVG